MANPPSLTELGRDLRNLSATRKVISLALPFISAGASLGLLLAGNVVLGVLGTVVLTFVTYGSVSHDLVHRTYRLPQWLNRALLVSMELLTLRSGTAYRLSHLNHHRYYPTDDLALDTEAKVAGKGFLAGVLDGPVQQARIFRWAWQHHRTSHRGALLFEAAVIVSVWLVAIVAAGRGEWGLLLYAALVTMGAWTIPLITVTVPHDPTATEEQRQTRAFRGGVFDVLAIGHLYHLEHHLYPAVPHQRWRELAQRLDGYLAAEGIEPITAGTVARQLDRRRADEIGDKGSHQV